MTGRSASCSGTASSGSSIGTTALCVLIGTGPALLAAGIHATMYVFVLSSSINGLCHHVGYRNFDNTATNLRFLALLTGGEGLHNNHHGFPRSPKFSFRASEIDPAWPIIRLLIALKLATPSKTIDELAMSASDLHVGGTEARAQPCVLEPQSA